MKRWGGIGREWAEENVKPWMVLVGLFVLLWFILHDPLPWVWAHIADPTLIIVVCAAIGYPVFMAGARPDEDDRS